MELPQSGQVLRVYSYSNSHYGKMDKGKIWRLIGRTGILACHLQQDRQECLSYRQFC